jgi:hypothetical protein
VRDWLSQITRWLLPRLELALLAGTIMTKITALSQLRPSLSTMKWTRQGLFRYSLRTLLIIQSIIIRLVKVLLITIK